MNDPKQPGQDEKLKNLTESLSEELGTETAATSSETKVEGNTVEKSPPVMAASDLPPTSDPIETSKGESAKDEISLESVEPLASSPSPTPQETVKNPTTHPAATPNQSPNSTVNIPMETAPASTASQAPVPDTAHTDVLNLEELDQILNAQDPQFAKNMSELQSGLATNEKSMDVKSLDLDSELLKDSIVDKEDVPKKPSAPSRAMSRARTSFAFSISKKISQLIDLAFAAFRACKTFAREIGPQSKRLAQVLKTAIIEFVGWFRALSKIQKINFFLFVTVSFVLIVVIGRTIRGERIFQPIASPLLKSFEQVATRVEDLGAEESMESFDNPLRNPEYVVLFKKMFVNLKAAVGHANPMAAFELFLEASSQDAAIELKDREKQLQDVIARVFEAMPYDEIKTAEGKNKLKLIIRRDLNQVVNKGRIKKVYFKTFFYKS